VLPSLHDHYLIGYEVDCEERRITLRTRASQYAGNTTRRTFLFTGVLGYHFQNDALGNIIFALQEVALGAFLAEHAPELRGSLHAAGALGNWARDPSSAQPALDARGIRAFTLSSSIGLSGWLLAKDAVEETG
jgi:hypothetical protein